ncbi:DUF4304 domain-containing protein [Blautia sp. RD014234]|nr:DUF4304 domain-containing protein [Blautia parvula]
MTSREKKNKVIQQVIKPALKEAGFHSLRGTQAFSIHKEACTIAVNIQSSQFNSNVTGFSFWLNIVVDTPDLSDEQLQDVTFSNLLQKLAFCRIKAGYTRSVIYGVMSLTVIKTTSRWIPL